MSDSILHEVAGGLARITLNRPEKRNALSLEMIEGLSRAIDAVREDASTRVVLVTARGRCSARAWICAPCRSTTRTKLAGSRPAWPKCTESS